MSLRDEFQKNYPFITCIKTGGIEYLGIVINFDNTIVSIYDYINISTGEKPNDFLILGEAWWWESNRKIPINIFLRQEMLIYRTFIKTFNVKDVEVIFGPVLNLADLTEKRAKRKSIQLVRVPKKIK
jgi:hypothetical protein